MLRLFCHPVNSPSTSARPVPARQLHAMQYQNPGYDNGDTLLHIAVRQSFCPHEMIAKPFQVRKLISNVGFQCAAEMSIITNDNGHVPVRLLREMDMPKNLRLSIYDQLVDLMRAVKVKPLKDKLELDLTEQFHTDEISVRRINNLKIAVYCANRVRDKIDASTTHPDFNDLRADQKEYYLKELNEIRRPNFRTGSQEEYLFKVINHIKQFKVANCTEFSYLVVDAIRKADPGLNIDVLSIRYGDHMFVVLDRDQASQINDISTWGSTAVVCDAWSGDVYPAHELPFKLQNYTCVPGLNMVDTNVLTTYNPRFHALSCMHQLPAKQPKSHQSDESRHIIEQQSSGKAMAKK